MTTTHVLAGVGLLALGLVAGYVLRGPRIRTPEDVAREIHDGLLDGSVTLGGVAVDDATAEHEPLKDLPDEPRQARPQDEADWWKPEGWQLDDDQE